MAPFNWFRCGATLLLGLGLFLFLFGRAAHAETIKIDFFCYDVDSITEAEMLGDAGKYREARSFIRQLLKDGLCVEDSIKLVDFTPTAVIKKDVGGAIVKGTIRTEPAPVFTILLNQELEAAGISFAEA